MRFLTPISDRGGNEPYSDTNAPGTLEMTQTGFVATPPPAGEAVLYVPTGGTSLAVVNPANTVTTIGPYAPPSHGPLYSNNHLSMVAASQKLFGVANQAVFTPILIHGPCTITGLRIRKGTTTTSGSIHGGIYNASGARLGATSATVATGTTASVAVNLPLSAGVAITTPGIYWVGIQGAATTADYYGWGAAEFLGPTVAVSVGASGMPASFTVPAYNSGNALSNVPFITTFGTA